MRPRASKDGLQFCLFLVMVEIKLSISLIAKIIYHTKIIPRMEKAVVDVLDLLPGEIDCWNENIKLHFNVSSGKFSNAPGVEIRVPGFGTTTSVEYVDPWIKSEAGYMNRLVAVL
eukprot:CAMPEP_0171528432 /NCGR_PEP_ID=MMETSP0959-20130129/11672_1 /TAXON_ID=87120 /ORGANISM="Aurantiochytrium limacinum, Strain ATCCMYA-1381" /LENGTH=114 /DNA_ID=CAMNT_0012070419 /DNA_START=258 /DNA_END=600 /DNA_ORIENTATION=+